ncbi:NUDIX hydrolase [Streptacidiphilus sp. ASG 303]|uniref:NUDIX hydrolase n=1 Tax=Streptomycetaceae TaxID=2062 RepID=UPI001E2EB14B|nr:NUDIX domain-containing protein [Streptacidiphilus sp. ASG 303]MCD0482834.1 NUDIX domain-containing protein [Streptacidiphilus sp. ASG 303]
MTLHDDALRALKDWTAPDTPEGGQEQLRLDYIEHLASHRDGLWRSCTPAHVTASAVVVDPGHGRVLLTLHPKVGRWLQMGGHCEPEDATLAGAALREATEESGIPGLVLLDAGDGVAPVRLDRHRVRCAGRDRPENVHLDVQYVAVAPAGAEAAISEESLDLRWFDYGALPELADRSVRALVERARLLTG